LQGELGTSHAYELGGDYRPSPDYRLGFLGADFSYDPATDAYRVEHIAKGDSWNEKACSPLNTLGANIRAISF
jgi:tricorn protease